MVDALTTVQQALVQHDSGLQRACVATCTAHITLGVMHLPSGDTHLIGFLRRGLVPCVVIVI